jgi:Pyruvate/2-oxoacid:ferredoxin oxidoreductase delta subunit
MTAYSATTIYFLSGTGNSYRVATWLGAAAEAHGATVRVASIGQAQPPAEVRDDPTALLGLVFPTHGFTAPWLMLHFVLRLPRRHHTAAFVMPTRAGTRLGNIYFPGFEGTAAYLVALLLALKGYHVRGVQAVDMPSNWTTLHPGFSQAGAQGIIDRAQARVAPLAEKLLAGGRHFAGFIELLLGLAILPISLGYLLMGRFFLAKLFFASTACNGCGVCAQSCPAQAINMWKVRGAARPYWTYRCESCMRCMNFCPQHAVEASYPLGVLFYFVTSVPLTYLGLNWLGARWPGLAGFNTEWVQALLQYPYALLSMALTYLMFTALLRVPVVNRLLTAAAVTHYYRRYHDAEATLKKLH